MRKYSDVARALHLLLVAPRLHQDLQTELVAFFSRPGWSLGSTPPRWPPLVYETCRALGGDPKGSGGNVAAAAVEVAVAAIDVADDLIDNEWQGPGRELALNQTLVLSWLSQAAILDGASYLGSRARTLCEIVANGSLGSCVGQDLDLRLAQRGADVSEDAALTATITKSGSLGAMACQAGAALATEDAELIATIGVFGRHLGTVGQILNDLAGVDVAQGPLKSDIRERKKTLPIAFLLRCAREENIPDVLEWFEPDAKLDDATILRLSTLIHDVGGLDYTWVMADAYYREAVAVLRSLEPRIGAGGVRRLRRLLPPVRARRRGALDASAASS
jgi:geranylgeranyl pyrophosphate synthase